MKEQDKNLRKKELNKTEISDLPDTGFKRMVIKMLTEVRRTTHEQSDRKCKKVPNRNHRAEEFNN